jgi:hypothetical protein
MFRSRNCPFWVDLRCDQIRRSQPSVPSRRLATYDFAVQVVLPHHDCVDSSRILKGQEGKAARATRRISHDRACVYLAKFGKVASEGFYARVYVSKNCPNERFIMVKEHRIENEQVTMYETFTICSIPVQPSDKHFPTKHGLLRTDVHREDKAMLH